MKRIILLLFALSASNVGADERFSIKWNIGNFGYGMNISRNDNNVENFFDILNIGIEHKETGIGIEYSPVNYRKWTYKSRNNNTFDITRYSFLNFNIYWNIFDLSFFENEGRFHFGPFSGINYINVDESDILDWNDFIYTAGFRTGLAWEIFENVYYHVLGGEIGYRNINGKDNFYVSVKVDIMMYFIVLLASNYTPDKYYR
jgi:hypothetical protein